jgi:hypothetical protein
MANDIKLKNGPNANAVGCTQASVSAKSIHEVLSVNKEDGIVAAESIISTAKVIDDTFGTKPFLASLDCA